MSFWRFVLLFLCCLIPTTSVRAELITDYATPYTGDDTLIQVTLRDGDKVAQVGSVEIALQVVGATADLRGLFLNLVDEDMLDSLVISGANVTSFIKSANAVNDLGAGVNTNPEGPFDLGIELGTAGIGKDDLPATLVVLSHPDRALSIADVFTATDLITPSGPLELLLAVRVTSVLVGDARNGSSKLGIESSGGIVNLRTPEPTSLALLGIGGAVAGLGWYRRSRRAE